MGRLGGLLGCLEAMLGAFGTFSRGLGPRARPGERPRGEGGPNILAGPRPGALGPQSPYHTQPEQHQDAPRTPPRARRGPSKTASRSLGSPWPRRNREAPGKALGTRGPGLVGKPQRRPRSDPSSVRRSASRRPRLPPIRLPRQARRDNNNSRLPTSAPEALKTASRRPKSPSRRPKRAPRGPPGEPEEAKTIDLPWFLTDMEVLVCLGFRPPKTAQEASKIAPREPKRPTRRPNSAQEDPNIAQEAPKRDP